MSTATVEQTFNQFRENHLFDGIPAHLVDELAPQVEIVQFAENDVVFREGDPGDGLYLVGKGSIRISKLGRGGQQETLSFIEPGSFFGEMALLDHEPRSATATAAEPAILAVMREDAFQRILEIAPSRLHLNFLQSVTKRLRNVNSHFITEMLRNERLSLVGTMANSIIHDLKNPIHVVRYCSHFITKESKDPRIAELTKMIDSAMDGMIAMTQELLDYARGSTSFTLKMVSVWKLLDDINGQALQVLPRQNIQCIKNVSYEGDVNIDLARFSRMLCNLIKNAREAMPQGGILTLAIDQAGRDVVLRISDTGIGIPAEILPRLFEPFVTHGKANGTGLGLAIAKSIVEGHEGRIGVTSEVGTGTTVEIRLPAPAAGA
ncbi:MAG TPA: ATP-binding protein [Chthoniobacterales bacterium]|nr:ATP-binding protein [Chthoniobacterales bacterium]